jgi:transcriptional regulator with XRE-family HTH domain
MTVLTKKPIHVPPADAVPFHYAASGLPDVWLLNGFAIEQTPYGEGVRIEDADGLHAALALWIATGARTPTGADLRFLRKSMRLSQNDLAHLLGCSDQSIARWEKDKSAIDPAAERLVRLLVLDHLGTRPDIKQTLAKLAEPESPLSESRLLKREAGTWKPAA